MTVTSLPHWPST